MSSDPTYRVYAIKYARHERMAAENFIGGDSHDVPMPLDYFVWLVTGGGRSFVVDTGFDRTMAAKRGRQITRPIADGLKALGVDPATVEDVIITHMHYDHAGNKDLFPQARYHLQDREMKYCTGRCMCHPVMRFPFEPDDVAGMVQRVFQGKVVFHDGDSTIAPGLSRAPHGRPHRRPAGGARAHAEGLDGARLGRHAPLRQHRAAAPVPDRLQRRRHARGVWAHLRACRCAAARDSGARPGGAEALSAVGPGIRGLDRAAGRRPALNVLATIENVTQAAVAGLLTGSIYGLMCVGLALIFGVMRVINFAQGDFMMLGMYAAYYAAGLLGLEALFGRLGGPYVGILLAVPLLYLFGYLVHALLISRVSGTRTAALEGEGHYAQLILTLGIALVLTNGAQMIFGSVMAALRTPLTTAAWQIPLGGDLSVFLNKSRTIAALVSVASILAHQPVHQPHAPRPPAARLRGQRARRNLHGHRRQPRAPHRLRARRGDHRARRRAARHQLSRSIPSSGWST